MGIEGGRAGDKLFPRAFGRIVCSVRLRHEPSLGLGLGL
jgi:hypothetical protein